MKLNKFYFENYDMDIPADRSNPRCVLTSEGADEILTRVIEAPPFTLTLYDLEKDELAKDLLWIGALQEKNEKLCMAVPFFTDKDHGALKALSQSAAEEITKALVEEKDNIHELISGISNGFSAERNLYHMLCGYIFDGRMFDFLEEQKLVTVSKLHPSGLDYLIVIYEDCHRLNRYSDRLLCSYNRLATENGAFVSFGDSDGSRKDLYRYYRQKELGQLENEKAKYVAFGSDELINNFALLINGQIPEGQYMEVYEYFGYCENGRIIVPVYDSAAYETADKIYDFVLGLVKPTLAEALRKIKDASFLTATAHGVPVEDIANEIYHLIFGEVNELLVRSGIVENPPYAKGEGRYLKCFER